MPRASAGAKVDIVGTMLRSPLRTRPAERDGRFPFSGTEGPSYEVYEAIGDDGGENVAALFAAEALRPFQGDGLPDMGGVEALSEERLGEGRTWFEVIVAQ